MKTHEPRVSIGLPVYNAEKYLREAVDSVLAQTYTNFELVIADNASSDATESICREYAGGDPRIRYFRNPRNLGAAPNFNRVFELSVGEYFKWAPYDDLIEPEFLDRCVQVLDNHPDVVLCYSRVKIIDKNSIFEVDHNPGPDTSSFDPSKRFRNLILHPEYALQQMGLIRSALLRKTNMHGSFPSSDEILLSELALLGNFYEIPDRLYLYRRHRGQSSQGSQRSRTYFFDTSLDGRILLPTWMYFGAAFKAIGNKSLTTEMKLSCYLTLLSWLLIPAHFRAVGKDVLLAVGRLIARIADTSRHSVSNHGRIEE